MGKNERKTRGKRERMREKMKGKRQRMRKKTVEKWEKIGKTNIGGNEEKHIPFFFMDLWPGNSGRGLET